MIDIELFLRTSTKMTQKRLPVLFVGHGSPMLALQDNELTQAFGKTGEKILSTFERPKAILAISAHWYTSVSLVNDSEKPEQIYDMYGFPDELYQLRYEPAGSPAVAKRVEDLLGDKVKVDNTWGIDHGTWTVLHHMFPKADIPVLQLSINGNLSPEEHYALGQKLNTLRDEGVLILGSGNIVHNLWRIEHANASGTPMAFAFNDRVVDAIKARNDDLVVNYRQIPFSQYAVPTPDHYLPLLYVLGAADKSEKAYIFNNTCTLGSLAMTCFVFGMA